ncbi:MULTISPECIES: CoA-acylating methylmalonate-semialdehyde dehydrogenase [Halomicrobium]|uniref:methylmalonate-semialdehyde dehydrogenase (CoA acylating) n=2 Tax=Halomicrobium mukohataei TaxID=57705 RepID=C7NX96_HALMD|nr:MULTISPECIES: CoA-acylating methylmalonate-semialdehyde dehydrogenase [Halomicrobium]ACV46461.1 methylmalonate-semialdehyde dehydrogenase [Halomicrobium mukohataei DSM 12286]QCD65010.1 CoA-acylating methylmalonate-semialdehyde dehydrogenase [Halomicrobium mukohataei]QFR19816.1 CoA-acylating methylmalonate-semialdehyde dehydrogenase [Halomicrobium sp. ZPS1]
MTRKHEQPPAATAIPDAVRNYVGGEWASGSADGQPVVDPATGERLADVPFSSADDVDRAVRTANDAFEEWRRTPPVERVQYLFDLKHELEAREEQIAHALSREHGKTVEEARGELRRGIENVEVATGIPNMLREASGTVEDVAVGMDETAVRQPLGTFAAVTPFNFPAMIPLWFLPYAVATGNTFVLKPSEKVPLTAQLIFEAIEAVEFPDGVVTLVNGGVETVDALLEHDGIEGVSFVGSTPVARHVYETAAQHGKRVQAQGGAKNFAVVTPSAELDRAVPNIVGSGYANAGQRCLANDVVVAVGDVYDELRGALVDAVEDLTVGRGLDEDTDVGPLITGASRERVTELIAEAVAEGAEVVVDGRGFEHPDYPDGNFLGPTLLAGVTADMEIAQTEIFGPVLCLAARPSLDDAIEMVNGTEYGNASSIFTEDGGEARQYRYEVDAGNIGVNVGVCAPMGFFHFGGTKESFFGDLHAQGEDAVAFYTDKTIEIERWYS